MALEKTKKQSVAAAVATSKGPDESASKKKTSNTDPNKQPGFAEQERALAPSGKGGGAAKSQDTKPKLGKVGVKSIVIAANGKLKAVVEATIHNANGVPGTTTRSYTLTGGSSLNPFECAEYVYDAFQQRDLSAVGLDSSYNIDPTGPARNAFMEEAISAVFDKSRFTDERDRGTWPEGYAERFDKRP